MKFLIIFEFVIEKISVLAEDFKDSEYWYIYKLLSVGSLLDLCVWVSYNNSYFKFFVCLCMELRTGLL